MPFWNVVISGVYSPEKLQVLIAAYESACKELGLSETDDGSTDAVARAVIRAGKSGIDDAAALQSRALLVLKNRDPAQARR